MRLEKKTTILLLVGTLACGLLLTACDTGTTSTNYNSQDSATVGDQQSIYTQYQPVPIFDYSLDRDILIQLYGLKNQAKSTYSYITSSTGKLLFTCPSIGFPIAADTQLTNSSVAEWNTAGSTGIAGVTVAQPEPNGIFPGSNGNGGTYIICDVKGEKSPVYSEPLVLSFPFPVGVDPTTGMLVPTGAAPSSMTIHLKSDAVTNSHQVSALPTTGVPATPGGQ